jgi:hypothetical protein
MADPATAHASAVIRNLFLRDPLVIISVLLDWSIDPVSSATDDEKRRISAVCLVALLSLALC